MARDTGGAAQRVPDRARVRILDLLQLGAALGADRLQRLRGKRSDPAATGIRWVTGVMQRSGDVDLNVGFPGFDLSLVANRERSNCVLAALPGDGPDGYEAGHAKVAAMRFLAPGALTIANGDAWRRLRQFNEHVLGTGSLHPFASAFLPSVRAAFAQPVRDQADIRAAMGRAMAKIVVGDVDASVDLAADVTTLFGVVESPVRRLLFGFLYHRRRARLYELLGRAWDHAVATGDRADPTLVGLACRTAPALDRVVLLQQIPHWMFTFTGSGTDLLTRTLLIVGSRPDVRARVLEEIQGAGSLDRADAIARLVYLDACFLETGRLFPPVTRTFHQKPANAGAAGPREVAHYFPLLQRDDRLGPTVHAFNPERWLAPPEVGLDAAAAASNLFLRGPRACPGMHLILFVCKAAAARQLGELGLAATDDRLGRDPLPVSFPTPGSFTTESRVGMASYRES